MLQEGLAQLIQKGADAIAWRNTVIFCEGELVLRSDGTNYVDEGRLQ